MFISHLISLDKYSLANKIFTLQREFNLPRFVKEGQQLIQKFALPNIIDEEHMLRKLQWQQLVKHEIHEVYEIDLKSNILGSSKLKDGPLIAEKFEEKKYLSKMAMHDARILFRIQSKTNNIQMNQLSDRENDRNL